MRKLCMLVAIFVPVWLQAQTDTSVAVNTMKPTPPPSTRYTGGKNIVKINLSSLTLSNYSFTYERGLSNHVSVSLGFRFMPKGQLPYLSQIKNLVNDNTFNFDAAQVGNTSFTPEVRFYMGKGRMRGFYIAPYARFSSFDMSLPVNYSTTVSGFTVTKQALFNGTVTSFSGGLMFGMQYPLSRRLVLDIWLVGGHYGSSNGNALATITPPMTPQEQAALQQQLSNISIDPFKVTGQVTSSTSATMTSTGPWAGVRALGLNLGFRF
jgi:hypothetical protein